MTKKLLRIQDVEHSESAPKYSVEVAEAYVITDTLTKSKTPITFVTASAANDAMKRDLQVIETALGKEDPQGLFDQMALLKDLSPVKDMGLTEQHYEHHTGQKGLPETEVMTGKLPNGLEIEVTRQWSGEDNWSIEDSLQACHHCSTNAELGQVFLNNYPKCLVVTFLVKHFNCLHGSARACQECTFDHLIFVGHSEAEENRNLKPTFSEESRTVLNQLADDCRVLLVSHMSTTPGKEKA
eukprot:Platyproteum_vivax@DN13677_c0_g1_i1.p1